MKTTNLVLAVVAMLAIASPAFAMTSVSLVGVGTEFHTTTDVGGLSAGSASQIGYGGGALVEFGMGGTGLEVGALYLINRYAATGTTTPVFSQNTLDIPVQIRFHFAHMFSLGLGGYYDAFLGNIGNGGSYSSSGLNTNDYGLTGSFAFHFSHILIGLRYNYGLSNDLANAPSGASIKDSNGMLYAGFRF